MVAKQAIKEMFRQVGDLVLDDSGIAMKGLLIRHLVLPDNLAGTKQVMEFIMNEISADTYVNIMPQYYPCGLADRLPGLNRRITDKEFQAAMEAARQAGIRRFDQRRKIFEVW
jgi:putative pyruvate formate lyase activating enzyme